MISQQQVELLSSILMTLILPFLAGIHFEKSAGSFQKGYNKIQVPIHADVSATDTLGFGIEAIGNGQRIQTTIILQPFEYED